MAAQAAMGLGPAAGPGLQDFTSDTEAGRDMIRPFESFPGGPDTGLPPTLPDDEEHQLPTEVPELQKQEDLDTAKLNAASSLNKNPVMILNEMKPGLAFPVSESGDSPSNKKFTIKVEVEGQEFEGSGASKKLAKQAVAKAVLNKIYKYNFTSMVQRSGSAPGTSREWEKVEMDQAVADRVGRLVLARYDELMKDDVQHSKRKVIAGIVMSRDAAMDQLEVICVSTGTKCVSGEYMSVTGTALNDCHAEIVSRRCLLDWLYLHLETLAGAGTSNVLEAAEEGGYRLRTDIRLHLYINTAPCGDARIFSPHEAEQGEDDDRHPNRRARGQLRTKIESGEGTIPVKKDQDVQTWDGVLQGARLLTMSCSDKLARWNLVGLQGALLSAYLQPVYLHSVVLGSLFHPTHMYRAVSGRLTLSPPAPAPPYTLHTPRLNLLSSREVRQPGKAPNHSVNWTVGCDRPEVVDAMKGRQDSGLPSRLCKKELFLRWLQLAAAPGLRRRAQVAAAPGLLQYGEAKLACTDFQATKQQLFKAFRDAGLGKWVEKPMEQDEFEESV